MDKLLETLHGNVQKPIFFASHSNTTDLAMQSSVGNNKFNDAYQTDSWLVHTPVPKLLHGLPLSQSNP